MTWPVRVHCTALLVQVLGRAERISPRQPIEVIEKFERRSLIFIGVLVSVIALGHRDAIRVAKAAIEGGHFPESFVRALNGEKIEHCCCDKYWPRIHQQHQPGIVDAVRYHAVQSCSGSLSGSLKMRL